MSEKQSKRNWWPFCTVLIVLILCVGFFLFHYPLHLAGSATDRVLGGAKELVKSLTEDNIRVNFESKLLSLADTNGGLLEVAILESSETFRREASSRIRGTTVTEASAPAVFKYHVPLKDGWEIEIQESGDVLACAVVAPTITPSLPIAFKADQLKTKSSEGWLRWDESEEMSTLMTMITPELEKRSYTHLESVRETARKSIKDFVRTWLLENGEWNDERFSFVDVKFADEVERNVSLSDAPLPVE